MKLRIVKVTPELIIQFLQGKQCFFSSNLPSDTELLDLKLDLFTKQVMAVVRSDNFEDIAESFPIPEFTLRTSAEQKAATKPFENTKIEPKPEARIVTAKTVQSNKLEIKMENEFSPDQRKLLSFQVKGDFVIVKPIQFLKEEWEDINEVVRSLGGKWVKGDIISYWEIPLR